MRVLRSLFALSLLSLTQCNSLSQQECTSSDWYHLGVNDGNRGASTQRVNQYQQACSDYQLKVDVAQWQQGYQQGLLRYCLPENGYRVGLAGERYYGVCDDALFVERYNQGKQQYDIKQRLDEINERIYSIDNAVSRIDSKLAQLDDKADLLRQKRSLLNEKNHLLDEKSRLRGGNSRFGFGFGF